MTSTAALDVFVKGALKPAASKTLTDKRKTFAPLSGHVSCVLTNETSKRRSLAAEVRRPQNKKASGPTSHVEQLRAEPADARNLSKASCFRIKTPASFETNCELFVREVASAEYPPRIGLALSLSNTSCRGGALYCIHRDLSLIHISEPTRQAEISYAVFCL